MSSIPEKIRVLVADDSLFIRTYLSALFRSDPDITVVGVASNGVEVVELAQRLEPDVITMDYHMPGKNGVDATAEIMRGGRPLPAIIMVSAFTGDDGELAKSALLASGAHVVVKPSGEVSLDIEKVSGEILRKIKEVGRMSVYVRNAYTRARGGAKVGATSHTKQDPARVVVIGASTGGPPLVEHLLAMLDPTTGISVVIVQHMSKYFTELFAERLNRVTGFHVREAVTGDTFEPGTTLVVPGGSMLLPYPRDLGVCAFTVAPVPHEKHEVMIDTTMGTIAACARGNVVGVLLSGMGHDGALGLRAITKMGGLTLAQDPETAPVSAMPNFAIQEGGVRETLPIEAIPGRINRYFGEQGTRGSA